MHATLKCVLACFVLCLFSLSSFVVALFVAFFLCSSCCSELFFCRCFDCFCFCLVGLPFVLEWYWENLKDDYAKKQRTCHHWCVGLQAWPGFRFAFSLFVCAVCVGMLRI